jgi:hypothetical protein
MNIADPILKREHELSKETAFCFSEDKTSTGEKVVLS